MSDSKGREETLEEIVARLIREYGDLIDATARQFDSNSDVDDIIHNVYMCVYRLGLRRIQGITNLAGWFVRVTRRQCLMRYRSQAVERIHLIEWANRQRAATGDSQIGGEMEKEEFRQAFAEALASLPPTCRDAVVACDIEGLTLAKCAEMAGISSKTVGRRRDRGRMLLQKKLRSFAVSFA